MDNDLFDKLLSDPEKLSAAVSAVSSMLGGGQAADNTQNALPKVTQKQPDGVALIKALKPFLSKQRQQKAEKAAKLLLLATMADEFKDIF